YVSEDVRHPAFVFVLAGRAGSQKSAQAEFLKKTYSLPAVTANDLLKDSASAPANGFVLQDYPKSKDQAERLAVVVRQKDLPPPIVIEIADRSMKNSPFDLDLLQSYYPEADVWTFDGT